MSGDRRTLFRAYMRGMNPAEDPRTALGDGRYVRPPADTGARIASRLEIEPTGAHLLVGGVGSGKSTELLEAQRRLMETGDIVALFADVPSLERIDTSSPILLPLAAARLMVAHVTEHRGELRQELAEAAEALNGTVAGRWDYRDHDSHPHDYHPHDDGMEWVPGLSRPVSIHPAHQVLTKQIGALATRVPHHFVVLLDGLDRAPDTDALAHTLVAGARLLHRAGIGVVVVGPQQLRYGLHRQLTEEFTQIHVNAATDIATEEGAAFFDAILARRSDPALLPEAPRTKLVAMSGGLTRDLIALARNAGEEAYAVGAGSIGEDHVDAAADRFGRARLLGITQEMARRLVDLRPRYGKAPELTFTPGTPPRYIVHPTVEPLIPGLRRSA